MKCSSTCCPYIIAEYKIPIKRVARQRRPHQGAKGLDMGNKWLLKEVMCGRLSSLSFTYNNGVCYFTQAWLSKAADIVGGKVGNID
jgi:hypothetical protein